MFMVRIRLRRSGAKKRPYYRIIAIDSREKRDGGYIDSLGYYAPLEKKLFVDLEKYNLWLSRGAQPSNTVLKVVKRYQETKL